jgi:plastocyanin
VRTLALSGAVLASLAVPATLFAAEPAPPSNGAPAPAEQQAPPSSPAAPPAPPTAPPAGGAQPPAGGSLTGAARDGRQRSGGGHPAPRSTLASGSAAAARSGSVDIVGATFSSFAFSPKSITVHAGDKVRWVNKSSAAEGHTVTGDNFDSGTFHQGDSYSHTFSKPGSYSYICALHPSMKGKVTVLGSSGGGGGGGGSQSSGGGGTQSSTGSGSGSGGTPGSAFPAGSPGVDPAGSGQLPVTGLPLIGLGLAGLGLVAAGLLLRRWAEYGWYY